MAFESISTLQKNRTYAPILIGVSLLIAVFWAFPAFSQYSDAQTSLTTVNAQYNSINSDFQKLNEMKEKIENKSLENMDFIEKISQDFNSSEILKTVMLNRFTQIAGMHVNKITISQISLDKGSIMPNGLYQWKVQMTVSANTVDTIVEYLAYLTTNSNFAFTLNDINLPIDTLTSSQLSGITESKTVSLPITLGVYYYP